VTFWYEEMHSGAGAEVGLVRTKSFEAREEAVAL